MGFEYLSLCLCGSRTYMRRCDLTAHFLAPSCNYKIIFLSVAVIFKERC